MTRSEADAVGPGGFLRSHGVHAGLIAAVLLGAGMLVRPPLVGFHHDDGVYAVTAQALAEGEGYRLTNLAGEPFQTKYPPVFPLLLAIPWALAGAFPANLPWVTLVPLLAGAGCGVASYLYGVRHNVPRGVAAAVAIASLSTPYWSHLSASLMSESVFTLLLLAGLLLAPRADESTMTPGRQWALGATVALAALTRSVGLALVGGVLFAMWRRRMLGWRLMVAAAAPLAAWHVWTALANRADDFQVLYYTSYSGWFFDTLDTDAFVRVVVHHMATFVIESAVTQFEGLAELAPFPMRRPLPLLVIGSVFWSAAFVGLKRDRAALATVAAYLVLIFVWPWPIGRFALPLFPVLWMAAAAGFLSRGRIAMRTAATVAVCAVTIASNGHLLVERGIARATDRGSYDLPDAPPPDEYLRMFSWIRQNVPRDATIGSMLDTMVAAYTDRHAAQLYNFDGVRLFYARGYDLSRATALLETARVQQFEYIARFPIGDWIEYEPLEDALAEIKGIGLAETVYVGTDPRFEVLRIKLAQDEDRRQE